MPSMVWVIPRAFPSESFAFGRAWRLGKCTLAINTAEARKVSESRTKAALVPNHPVIKPPIAAPIVNIADQVTEAIAFAGRSSRFETIDGIAAVFAGSKKVENAS